TAQLYPSEKVVIQSSVVGLSGLTVDADGQLWAVPEEARVLISVNVGTGQTEAYPIEGLDDAVELESLAYLSPGRFLVGTEAEDAQRQVDALVTLRADGGRFVVEQNAVCPYAHWHVRPEANRGIEGICHSGAGEILVATEVVEEVEGHRYAPLARRNMDGWHSYSLELTSDTGKISGLSCTRASNGDVLAIAIERHFGRTRLLSFRVPNESAPVHATPIQPRVLADLDGWVREQAEPPNFEGIARLPDGRIAVVVDNYYHHEQAGPSTLFVFPHAVDANAGQDEWPVVATR
ncbi:MAG: esterase-like activity of phytase family protein, partial [Myxococcota bacterium]